jgi:Holliday junction resolvase RusA-like endonuclease
MSQGGFKFDADLPLRIAIRVFQAIPKATSKAKRLKMLANDIRPTKTPDPDNIGKIVMDALNGVAYEDDKQIVEMNVTKFYGTEDQMEVTIREVTQ